MTAAQLASKYGQYVYVCGSASTDLCEISDIQLLYFKFSIIEHFN